jgi:hypothetical protein
MSGNGLEYWEMCSAFRGKFAVLEVNESQDEEFPGVEPLNPGIDFGKVFDGDFAAGVK